jgi:hypothetical protein
MIRRTAVLAETEETDSVSSISGTTHFMVAAGAVKLGYITAGDGGQGEVVEGIQLHADGIAAQ